MANERLSPETTTEFTRFKDSLRRVVVAVPKKEVDEKMAEHRRLKTDPG